MVGQTNQNKTEAQPWVDKAIVAQIDGMAARKGISRTLAVPKAPMLYLDDGDRSTMSQ